jgi:hypothetical protein
LSDSSSRFQTYFDLYVIFFAFLWILFSCLRFYHYLGEKLDGSLKKLLEDTAFDIGASDAIKLPLVALACISSIGLFQLIFEHYSITVKNCPEKLTELVIYARWFFILAINVLPVPILLLLGTGRTDNIDEIFVLCIELVSVFLKIRCHLHLELIFSIRNNYSSLFLS